MMSRGGVGGAGGGRAAHNSDGGTTSGGVDEEDRADGGVGVGGGEDGRSPGRRRQTRRRGGRALRRQEDEFGSGEQGQVLSHAEFASFNVSGTGYLNLCELSLLLLHRKVGNCYFQLAHSFRELELRLDTQLDYEGAYQFLLATGLDETEHRALFGTGDDEAALQAGVGATLREFAHGLWACLERQHEYETRLEKDGRILVRSGFNRIMCRVASGLDLPPGQAEKPSWFRVYCTTSSEFNRLVDRRAFSRSFLERIETALQGRGDEHETAAQRQCRDYQDNQVFTVQMDKAILHWKARSPDELQLSYTKSALPSVNFPRLTFRPLVDGGVRTTNANTTVYMQAEATEENTWVLADQVLTSGMHYWTVRCDAKGSSRRYVGVGVGKPSSPYPLGAARILSEGVLKSGSSASPIPRGFSSNDLVGVFLDLNRNTVAFDVNGHKRGEIELPGLAPGEGVQPLAYLFYPGDKVCLCVCEGGRGRE